MASTQKINFWSELPLELFELVLRKLVLNDYLKCRQVCRFWRNIVNDAKKRCPPAPQFPLLMRLPHDSPNANRSDPAIILDITQNTMHTLPTHAWEGDFYLLFSQDGWLLFQNPSCYIDRQLCSLFWLFNPVSGEKHQLPPLPLTFSGQKYDDLAPRRGRATLSFTSDSQNLMVAVSYCATIGGGRIQQLSFCKVTHKSWTLIETKGKIHEILLVGWKLYAVIASESSLVTIFDLRNPNAVRVDTLVMLGPKPTPLIPVPSFDLKSPLACYTDGEIPTMTVDSARGEVLLVFCHLDVTIFNADKNFALVKGFRIFKMDMSGPKWMEVDSLGDRVLLMDTICEGGVHVISTAEINGPPELTDCVLFCVRNKLDPLLECNLMVFFLENKTIMPLSQVFPNVQASGRCLWFSPSL